MCRVCWVCWVAAAPCLLPCATLPLFQGATKGNSGIIHAGFDDKPGSVRQVLLGSTYYGGTYYGGTYYGGTYYGCTGTYYGCTYYGGTY